MLARNRQGVRAPRHPRHAGRRDLRAADRREFGLGDVLRGAHPAHRAAGQAGRPRADADQPAAGVASQLLALAGSRPPPPRSSTSRRPARCGPASASPTTTSTPSPTRSARPTSDELRPPAPPPVRRRLPAEHLATASTACWRAWRSATTRTPGSTPHFPLDDVESNRIEFAAASPVSSSACTPPSNHSRAHGRSANGSQHCPPASSLLTAVPDADLWQSSQVKQEFNDVLAKAGPHAAPCVVLPDVEAMLDRHLAGRPTPSDSGAPAR